MVYDLVSPAVKLIICSVHSGAFNLNKGMISALFGEGETGFVGIWELFGGGLDVIGFSEQINLSPFIISGFCLR